MEDPILLSELRRTLAARGVVNSAKLQLTSGRSQPTVSRLLSGLAGEILTLSQGHSTRYALPRPLCGAPARQPLHWVDEAGQAGRWGELIHIAGSRVHVQAEGVALPSTGAWPWFLVPLRAEGFLGRALTRRQLAALGLPDSPERWTLEDALFAALHTPDAPGALVLIELSFPDPPACDLDTLAATIATTLPAGSSAGGESAKFLARCDDGHPLLVKFSPPRGTPFGERWHDLLHADMHFDNLSLFVDAADLPRGRFTLAPLYDMLPMRWRPDPSSGELGLLAFTPDPADLQSAAAPLAIEFWGRLSAQGDASRGMRQLAASQRRLLGAS